MTITEFQQTICDILNADSKLVEGGCRAMAENALDILASVTRQLNQARGIAAVVRTPTMHYGGRTADGRKIYHLDGVITFAEQPAISRTRPNAITALDCAIRASELLGEDAVTPGDITQTADTRAGLLTAEFKFENTVTINT